MAETKGLKELFAALDSLGRDVRAEARAATNAGAQVVKRSAIQNARAQGLVASGALVNNIAVKREKGTPSNIFEYHIGVRHGPESKGAQKIAVRGKDGKIRFQYENDPFYWWFWEFGHYNIYLRRHVPAKPFLTPAIAANTTQIVDAMKNRLAARIERYVNKALT